MKSPYHTVGSEKEGDNHELELKGPSLARSPMCSQNHNVFVRLSKGIFELFS